MLELMWSIVSHPSSILGREGAAALLIPSIVAVSTTVVFLAVVGDRIMKRSAVLAAVMGAVFLPILIVVFMTIILPLIVTGRLVPIDEVRIFWISAIVLIIVTLPTTILTSVAYVCFRLRLLRR